MPHTINTKGLEKLLQRELLAPSVYELSLMTSEEQKKRIKEYKKDLAKIK